MSYPSDTSPNQSRARWCLKSAAVGLVIIFLLYYFVLMPAVEMVLRSIGSILSMFTLGFEQILTDCYDLTCKELSQNLEVGILLGHPIHCPALEEVEWNAADEAMLGLSFSVEGPLGVGRAHARVGLREDGIEIESLSVVTNEGIATLRP